MSLEDITSGHSIADLNPANPGGDEVVGQGDDHIRNIKKALRYTFPAVSGTVVSTQKELNFAAQGGTVSGSVVVKGDVDITGSLTCSATGVFKTGLNVLKEMSVGGAVVLQNTLTVYGKTNIVNALSVEGAVVMKGAATVQDLVITGTLSYSATASAVTGDTPTWSTITLGTGYAKTSGTSDTEPGCYKDTTGRVWLRGRIVMPNPVTNIIGYLPSGMWPLVTNQMVFPRIDIQSMIDPWWGTLGIDASGTMRIASTPLTNLRPGGEISLDNLSFQTY